MKPLLPRDRALNAVPALSSLARFGAWAKESLIARGIAVLIGLCVLALIGGSAIAGGAATKAAPGGALPSAAPATPGAPPDLADAGSRRGEGTPALAEGRQPITTVRTDLAPREKTPPEPVDDDPGDTAHAPARGASTANVTRATPDDPVDLNTARVDDLRRLPGIGAKRAEAVLALRARLPGGRFRQIEDLLKVKGIGRAMLKRLHPLVRLSGV